MARDDLHFRLRIPEALKDQVEKAADFHGRSMTAEIVRRLAWTFDNMMYEMHGPDAVVATEEPQAPDDQIGTIEINLETEREMLRSIESGEWMDFSGDNNQFFIDMTRARVRMLERQLERLKKGDGK